MGTLCIYIYTYIFNIIYRSTCSSHQQQSRDRICVFSCNRTVQLHPLIYKKRVKIHKKKNSVNVPRDNSWTSERYTDKKKTLCFCDVKQVDEDKCEFSFVNALDCCTNQQQKRTTLAIYTQGFVRTPCGTQSHLFCPVSMLAVGIVYSLKLLGRSNNITYKCTATHNVP